MEFQISLDRRRMAINIHNNKFIFTERTERGLVGASRELRDWQEKEKSPRKKDVPNYQALIGGINNARKKQLHN